jgi:hypothetical protein
MVVVHRCIDPRRLRHSMPCPQSFLINTNSNGLSFSQPFSTLLFARMGNGIATNQLMKMVAGAINPGRPVANLYVSIGDFRLLKILIAQQIVISFLCGVTTLSLHPSTLQETSRWASI